MNPMFAIFKIEEIKNEALQTAANVALLVLAVLYLALIFWTFADARRRIDDPLLVACATLASFFPFIGTIVYLIVRPRARDDRRRGAAGELGLPPVPALRLRGAERLSALSELHAQAQGAVLLVLEADQPRLAPVPVLRGRDERAVAVGHVLAPSPSSDDRPVDRRGGGHADGR
jgi:hypothetical protein